MSDTWASFLCGWIIGTNVTNRSQTLSNMGLRTAYYSYERCKEGPNSPNGTPKVHVCAVNKEEKQCPTLHITRG